MPPLTLVYVSRLGLRNLLCGLTFFFFFLKKPYSLFALYSPYLKALFNATGILYLSLSPSLNILRLWGRRKVHNPQPPIPWALKFLIYLFSPSQFFPLPSILSSIKGPFALSDPQSILHRGTLLPSRPGSTLGFSCPPLLFLVLFIPSVECG
jgi:hypothetical protein